jgi:hypothetical protein
MLAFKLQNEAPASHGLPASKNSRLQVPQQKALAASATS